MQFRKPVNLPLLAFGVPDQGYTTARVTSPFGQRGAYFHGGLDIGNERLGDVVVAAAAGVVEAEGYLQEPWSESSSLWGTGNFGGLMVVVNHGNDVFSIYAHMRMTTVSKGDRVMGGQKLGEIGDTGSADPRYPGGGGGHLHFGMQAPVDLIPAGLAWEPTYLGIGIDVDPWPLISGAKALEDDMALPKNTPLVECTVLANSNLRKRPLVEPPGVGVTFTLKANATMQIIGYEEAGGSWRLPDGSHGTGWYLVSRDDVWWVVAGLVRVIRLTAHGKTLFGTTDDKATAKLAEVSKAVGTLAASNRAEKAAIDALITVVTTP